MPQFLQSLMQRNSTDLPVARTRLSDIVGLQTEQEDEARLNRLRGKFQGLIEDITDKHLSDLQRIQTLSMARDIQHKEIENERYPWWKRLLYGAAAGISQVPAGADVGTLIGAGIAGAGVSTASPGIGNNIIHNLKKQRVDAEYAQQVGAIQQQMQQREAVAKSVMPAIVQAETTARTREQIAGRQAVAETTTRGRLEAAKIAAVTREHIAQINNAVREKIAHESNVTRRDIANIHADVQKRGSDVRTRLASAQKLADIVNKPFTIKIPYEGPDGRAAMIEVRVPYIKNSQEREEGARRTVESALQGIEGIDDTTIKGIVQAYQHYARNIDDATDTLEMLMKEHGGGAQRAGGRAQSTAQPKGKVRVPRVNTEGVFEGKMK